MGAAITPELAGELSPEVRVALAAVLEKFTRGLELIDKLAQAVAALDQIDDIRAKQLDELRLTVRLLCQAQGLETKGEPLVELIRSYTEPASSSIRVSNLGLGYCIRCGDWIPSDDGAESGGDPYHRSCYQAKLRELRDERSDLGA